MASWTEFYVATTGSNLNAGSTEADAASLTYASGNWDGTSVFTVASGDPVADGVAVGDFASVYADGSTVTGYVGRVTARTTTTITVSTTAKSGTAPTTGTGTRTLKIGGRWAGPNGTSAFPFGFVQNSMTNSSSHPVRVNFKDNATYSITAAMTHGNAGHIRWEGYTTTAGDGGLAIIDGGTSGASYVLLTISAVANTVRGFWFRNNGATGSANGVTTSSVTTVFERCRFSNVRGTGLHLTAASTVIGCEAHTCNASNTGSLGGFTSIEECVFWRCWSHDNSGSNSLGFGISALTSEPITFVDCVSENNGGDGFATTAGHPTVQLLMRGCAAVNNGGDGLDFTSLTTANVSYCHVENCIFSDNGGYGINGDTVCITRVANCAFYSNTSGETTALYSEEKTGCVTLSADPFTDAANGNLALNSTSGGGADCKGAGMDDFLQDSAVYSGTTSSSRDIGPAQAAASGGAGGVSRARIVNGG